MADIDPVKLQIAAKMAEDKSPDSGNSIASSAISGGESEGMRPVEGSVNLAGLIGGNLGKSLASSAIDFSPRSSIDSIIQTGSALGQEFCSSIVGPNNEIFKEQMKTGVEQIGGMENASLAKNHLLESASPYLSATSPSKAAEEKSR